jgi:putative membrane protein
VQKAATGGMREVKLGELAQARAIDGGVKAFGQRMVADHSQANNELKSLAEAKGIMIKSEDKKDRDYDKLSAKAGNDFDEDYIKMMIRDHKKTIKLFEDEAEDGKDADLKAFASKTLPTLREHLAQVESLKEKND